MKRLELRSSLFACGLLLGSGLNCDRAQPAAQVHEADKAAAAAQAEPAAPAGPLFAKEIRARACELLTAEMAAQVLGVDAGALERQTPVEGWCTWRNKAAGEATISFVSVSKDVERATNNFNNAYKGMSPAELADAMKKINDKVDEQAAKGAVKPGDAEQAKSVGGALGGVLAGGFAYEDVPGIGDAARLALNSREVAGQTYFDNKLHVRVKNLDFTLSLSRREAVPRLLRDELTKLGALVVAGL